MAQPWGGANTQLVVESSSLSLGLDNPSDRATALFFDGDDFAPAVSPNNAPRDPAKSKVHYQVGEPLNPIARGLESLRTA